MSTLLSKEYLEKQIEIHEGIVTTLNAQILEKQNEIDSLEEDDTTYEQTELDEIKEKLDEVNNVIEVFEEQLQEAS